MKVGLIGVGMVADMHLSAIAQTGGAVTLAGVYSRDPARRHAFTSRHAGLRCYGAITEMANDPDLDFVILATPPDARSDIAQQMAKAGKPVLMEKPIERTFSAAQNIVAGFQSVNVPLGVVLQHRARPAAKQLMDILSRGLLGRIALVEVRVPWWRDQSYYDTPGRGSFARDGGGVLITQAIHTADLMLQFAGSVRAVQAMAARTALHDLEAEDFATAGVEFVSGAVGSITATTAAFPGTTEEIVLHCDQGTAILTAAHLRLVWRTGQTETFGGDAKTGAGADPMAFSADWHSAIIADFADAIKSGREPLASGRSGLAVHRLIDAIQMSSRQQQRVTIDDEVLDE